MDQPTFGGSRNVGLRLEHHGDDVELRQKLNLSVVVVLGVMAVASSAFAASDVSNNSAASNRATGSAVASVASSQTATIISSAATGGFSGGSGGFSTGGSGGFSTGGSGGFNSGGGAPAPTGTGGSGGFNSGTPEGAPAGAPPGADKGSLLLDNLKGRAAGSDDDPSAIWIQTLGATIRRTELDLGMHGLVLNAMGGFDHRFDDDYLLGLAAGFEHTSINTTYNQGYYRTNGYTLSPYGSITLTPKWTIDGSVGYTYMNYSTARQGESVTGTFSGGRWFAASNLTGGFAAGDWRFQPKLGVSFTHEMQNAYTDSSGAAVDSNTFSMGSLTGGGKLGYDIDGVLPYLKVLGEWDFKQPDAVLKANGQMSEVDAGGGLAGLGVEISKDQMTGSLELDYNSVLRRDTDVFELIGRVHIAF